MGAPRLALLVYKIPRDGLEPFVFDFAELGLPFGIARAFRRALEANLGHRSIETQSKAFMALRKLSRCLLELGIIDQFPLPRNVLSTFADWLDKSSLGPSAQVSLTKVRQLLAWCERNTPNIVAKDLSLIVPKIRKLEFGVAKGGIPEPVLKEILRACYDDIERTEKERAQIRRICAGKTESPEERDFLKLTRDLMIAGQGQFAKQPAYHRAGGALARRVDEFGGSRRVADVAYLSPKDLLPFLVAIMAQASGNPESIKIAESNCVVAHPIRDDIERIIWLKKRSSREQRADFPKGKEWSAPNLVRRLNRLTDEIRPRAVRNSRNKLFICYRWYTRTVGMPGKEALLQELKAFIERHSLPQFQFRDLRRTGGQVVQAVRGSERDAQERLNHEEPSTTRRYTATQSVLDREEQVIHAHQLQFVQLAVGVRSGNQETGAEKPDFDIPEQGMDTTFGFKCKDPLAGIAPGSIRGSMCVKFFGCSGCPGAVIPLDDVSVVARLLSSAEALEEARARSQVEGWWKRYEAIYEPTRLKIVDELLPSVSTPILERAKPLASPRLIPRLE